MTLDKTKLGAGATLLALGGLAAAAIGQSGEGSGKPAAAPVLVRTQVIRQTVRVVRHKRPRHRRHVAVPAAVPRRASAAPPPSAGPAAAAPFRPRTSAVTRASGGTAVAAPAPDRVTTRTSGGSGGEHEHEHGDD